MVGDFRVSSIDSIFDLIEGVKDSVIRKTNIHSLGGAIREIEVSNAQKKISFRLFNTTDTTADKIIAILNSYMPGEEQKKQIMKYRE